MRPFTEITAIAASLPIANIDTDQILPGEFLTTTTRAGLGRGLFARLRENPDFVLNRAPWDRAAILIADANFGCGSSREHAPWALLDFGIHCIIAPSFADIFFNNCFKNGILPIVLEDDLIAKIRGHIGAAPLSPVTVNLNDQTISVGNSFVTDFSIDSSRKNALLKGADEIDSTLRFGKDIDSYETTISPDLSAPLSALRRVTAAVDG